MGSHQKCVISRHSLCQLKVVMKTLGRLCSVRGGLWQADCSGAEAVLGSGTSRTRSGRVPAVEFTAWGRRGGVGEQAVLAHTAWLSPGGPCEGVVCQDEAGCCLWTEIMVLTSMAPARTHDIRAKPSTLGQSTGWPCTEHCLALQALGGNCCSSV